MDNIIVGERIKELRLKRKMTREELAEVADLSVSFIYEIETGKKGFSAYTLGNLSRALAVEADYILLGKPEEGAKTRTHGENGMLSRDSLLCIQQLLMDAYNEIQELMDGESCGL